MESQLMQKEFELHILTVHIALERQVEISVIDFNRGASCEQRNGTGSVEPAVNQTACVHRLPTPIAHIRIAVLVVDGKQPLVVKIDAINDGIGIKLISQGSEVLLIPCLDLSQVDGSSKLLAKRDTLESGFGDDTIDYSRATAQIVGHHTRGNRCRGVDSASG